jgi:hypothetical protein
MCEGILLYILCDLGESSTLHPSHPFSIHPSAFGKRWSVFVSECCFAAAASAVVTAKEKFAELEQPRAFPESRRTHRITKYICFASNSKQH